MSSTDDDMGNLEDDDIDIDAEIYRLADEGYSSREIAKRLPGVSRSTVKRRIDARAEELSSEDDSDDDDSDLDAAELARLNAMDSGQPVTPPVRYCGVDLVATEQPGWDAPQIAVEWHYRDAADRSPDELALYRYKQGLETSGRWDEAEAFQADLDRQYAADPELRRVEDLGNDHHYEYIGPLR